MRHNEGPSRSSASYERLERVLTELGWKPEPSPDADGFHVDFEEPDLSVSSAFAGVVSGAEQFVFYLNVRFLVDAARRDEVARLITRANWGLLVGNFEMDYADGHLRFKTSIDFEGDVLTEAAITNAILAALNAVERFSGALIDVAINGRAAEEAYRVASQTAADT